MSRVCLDTSAYSNLMRGDDEVVALVDSAEWVGIPSVVLGELWVGFLGGSRRAENESDLREFMSNPAVEELPIDGDIARVYAEITTALRQSGTPVPTNDIWIAACAARHGATVVTYDEHYRGIHRVGSRVLDHRKGN